MSSNIFPEVLWNGILGDEEERGPEISKIINGRYILCKCRLLLKCQKCIQILLYFGIIGMADL